MARVNADITDPGVLFQMKDGSGRLKFKKYETIHYLLFFLSYIFKFDQKMSRDMVQKIWNCIFEFSLSLSIVNVVRFSC